MFLIGTSVSISSIQWDMILGGFALFLFGIGYMGDGLKSIAGDKLRDYIEKYTNKPWKGILIGLCMTAVIQSSSATTAICIGFVRAGIMRLEQAVGIIMGANIGTTVTAFLIGMNVEDLALYFVFVGVLLFLFGKRKKQRYLGQIVLGFGLLFFGLKMMGDQLGLVGKLPEFSQAATAMAHQPILAMFASIVMTGIIQSSSAVIGVVQKLYQSGALELAAVLPFVFGSNIGTTVTAVLASLGGSTAAKRTAGIHVMFNVSGCLLFMCFLSPVTAFIQTLAKQQNLPPMMQIAVAHIIFNITMTIICYPLIKYMVVLVKKIVRGDDERIEIDISGLDSKLVTTLPSAAISSAKKTSFRMAELAVEQLSDTKEFFNTKSSKFKNGSIQLEDAINSLDSKITNYLISISHENLSEKDANELLTTLQVVKNIERIGDIAMNLVGFYDSVFDERTDFSDEAKKDINEMSDTVSSMLEFSIAYFIEGDETAKKAVEDKENYLDMREDKARKSHFARMTNNECNSAIAASIYVDILSNLERMGDHCDNIVKILDDPAPAHEMRIEPDFE